MSLTDRELLQQSELRFNAAIKAVRGVLWTTSASGEMLVEQEAWGKLTGQTFDEYRHLGV
jgi:PAS domain-containing protein